MMQDSQPHVLSKGRLLHTTLGIKRPLLSAGRVYVHPWRKTAPVVAYVIFTGPYAGPRQSVLKCPL